MNPSRKNSGLDDQILALLSRTDYAPMNCEEMLPALGLTLRSEQALRRDLRRMDREGRIARIKGSRYIIPTEADLIPGVLRVNRAGKGFLQPDDPKQKEIVVPESNTSTALNEDRVLVRLDVRPQGRRVGGVEIPPTGTVIRILERRRTTIVGSLQRSRQFLYVVPDDPRISQDIYVPEPRDVGRPARTGDKVVVELKEWTSRHLNPEGEVIEVLGAPDAEGVDMLSVIRQYGLELSFPKEVLDQARSHGTQIRNSDLRGRQDCRGHDVITIDPDDAKDFDDAFYLQRESKGGWRLWVHIADVSHYVKPGTILDDEARKRGNSTYLVDRVIPMLPEALSNELCSLKPHADRLTKCVEFQINDDGRVQHSKFYPAVIHSKRRFSYKEALGVLQGRADSPIEKMLKQANDLAQKIRRHRFQNGSLDLDFPENKIRLDDEGKITHIERMENDISHQLIEEFMLLANEAVAGELMRRHTPAVYRIHEPPEERRLNEYRQEVLSHDVPCGNLSKPGEIQKLLARLNKLPIGQALKIGFLKSLMRARYAVEPIGHFGLAKKKYTHFTSPIRRYADLVVHRSLFEQVKLKGQALKETAEHISRTERNSADAERDSKDVKLFAHLNAQIASGERVKYTGLVTDLRNFGFFVDVQQLGMSGLVPLSSLEDDFYVLDPSGNRVVGRRSRRIIKLGDNLDVQVLKVDSFKKQVDFTLVSDGRKRISQGSSESDSRRSSGKNRRGRSSRSGGGRGQSVGGGSGSGRSRSSGKRQDRPSTGGKHSAGEASGSESKSTQQKNRRRRRRR